MLRLLSSEIFTFDLNITKEQVFELIEMGSNYRKIVKKVLDGIFFIGINIAIV